MGSTTIKNVKGKDYLYFVYYVDRKKKELYCGLASKSESKKKSLQFELEHLKEQKKNLVQKVVEIESKIKLF